MDHLRSRLLRDSHSSSSDPHQSGKGTYLGKLEPYGITQSSTPKNPVHTNMDLQGGGVKVGSLDLAPLHSKNPEEYSSDNLPYTTNTSSEDSTTVFSLSDFMPFLCDLNSTSCLNDSSLFNISQSNATSVTFGNSTGDDGTGSFRYWTLFLLLFPIFTVFGNVLVCMSVYRERTLRTATNYFICSLAIADLMVAVLVMPGAVYMEVKQYWALSDALCDAWVASDVMACTASILNLTAISVDRFIAVTQPIKYSKHKNSKRVFVTLALTWVISAAIAAPIALGVNYSDRRQKGVCAFFNSDFIIYSSMGSFYIPSIIMIFLYYRIYRVLHLRARASMAHKKARELKKQVTSKVIENTATVNASKIEPTVTTGLASSMDNGKISTYNTNKCQNQLALPIPEEDTITNVGTMTDSQSSERYNEEEKSPESIDDADDDENDNDNKGGQLIVNPIAVKQIEITIDGNGNGTCTTTTQTETETRFNSPALHRKSDKRIKEDNSIAGFVNRKCQQKRRKEKRTAAKFNFHMRTSRKRKEKSSSKREKKATKTLAIVLGVFLFCWVPFFTINIINAICIRYDLFETSSVCNVDMILFNFFVWLGYINSFLNPVIYTIFNPEFRKAFKRILTQKCY